MCQLMIAGKEISATKTTYDQAQGQAHNPIPSAAGKPIMRDLKRFDHSL